jgi:hypothetical protein
MKVAGIAREEHAPLAIAFGDEAIRSPVIDR